MGKFKYSREEEKINKVLKMNQERSQKLLKDEGITTSRLSADKNIQSSEQLLKSLGLHQELQEAKKQATECGKVDKLQRRPVLESWKQIEIKAEKYYPNEVVLEDILSREEMNLAIKELNEINEEFSRKTSIINKIDLRFLAVATALQVVKSLLFPYVANKLGYGNSFNSSSRLAHNDNSIEKAHKEANDKFRDKKLEKNEPGHWINLLYQTPPYDITVGSSAIGINMEGKYHRLHTLGHDPILGWIFGTANILTDVITLNNFQSYRVIRHPKMKITPDIVPISSMFYESYLQVKQDFLNLPAAIFAEFQHLKSDVNTKLGLPIPVLETFNENLAGKLYKNQYDTLCLARDIKIVGGSFLVSTLIDMIIGLIHGLFRDGDESKTLYEVRTRKILLISNTIATTSSIIATGITQNPKSLDIGSLLSTVSHLFIDIRFISKIKREFIENEIDKKIQTELDEINRLYDTY